MESRFYYIENSDGAPASGLAPDVTFVDKSGTVRPLAAVVEIAPGLYEATFTDADKGVGCILVMDFGDGAYPRRVTDEVYKDDNSNQFFALASEDDDGSLWAGAAPTVILYRWQDGTDRLPNSPVTETVVAPWLHCWTPSPDDVVNGASLRVQGPTSSYTGDCKPYLSLVEVPGIAGTTTPADIISAVVAKVSSLKTARLSTQAFLAHLTGDNFANAPLAKREAFFVTLDNEEFTHAFGRLQLRETSATLVVALGTPPFTKEQEREKWRKADTLRIADALETKSWFPEGVQTCFYRGSTTDKLDPNWWLTEIQFTITFLQVFPS